MSVANAQRIAGNDFYGALIARTPSIEERYRAVTPNSARLFDRAGASFPGGYTRDAVVRGPYATFVKHGRGAILTDADGRDVVDLWFNATSLPIGHAHPAVVEAVAKQMPNGTAYYAPSHHEIELAELLLERLSAAERVRFTNSGSEAVMMALRFARGATGRTAILKFEGSYHGSYDDVSWSVSPSVAAAGDALRPVPVAESIGLTGTAGRVFVSPFNNIKLLREMVEKHHTELAAIIVEPLANRIGLILPDQAFLAETRALCDRFGIVLIFDEVIAFRLGYHGAQGETPVKPDLTTLGKIIGGGFPVGAVAGKASILDISRPGKAGRVTHFGTFNANPVTSVAGIATMRVLTPEAFDQVNGLGAYARQRLTEVCDGLPLQVTGEGSLFKVTAINHPIRNYRDAAATNKEWEMTASLALLCEGFLLTTNLAGCVSTVTERRQIDNLVDAVASLVAI